MFNIDFNKPIHVHFIGIGGISMSGLAQILLERGFTVSGSDRESSELSRKFESAGCKISYPQSADNIDDSINLVVYTAAIHPDNPEYAEVVRRNIPMLTRAELLGQIMTNYKVAINVAGTHGKTTTTSMITEILLTASADPTISVGGIMPAINGNIRVGKSDLFVTEACEYTNSFLSFNPTLNVVLNVKEDHLDFFKDINDIRNSFRRFNMLLPKDGVLVINSDIDDYAELYEGCDCKVITFGSNPAASDYSAKEIEFDDYGSCSYILLKAGKEVMDEKGEPYRIHLSIPGEHNVYNSLGAIAACEETGIAMKNIAEGLHKFTGTDRRFQKRGEFNGVTVIDDYAHHPDEIKATLESAKHYPHRSIWCVFQPHTYTRTKALMGDFAEALSMADHVVLAKIYPARETDNLGISSATLQDEIVKINPDCTYIDNFSDIAKFLEKNCINGDLLITMGAGDVNKIAEMLIK